MNKLLYCIGFISDKLESNRKKYKRYANMKKLNLTGADNVSLGYDVSISHPENIRIGYGTYINGGDVLASDNAHILIGKNCLISYNVHIRTDMHRYKNANSTIKEQGHMEQDIVIGNDVWIGYGVQIMPGVTVADGCVLGAGAIVTHSTEPYCVYAGVPAIRIKRREGI